MSPNFHFSELMRIFNAHGVKYLVVGGYAVMLYSEPRFTKDLDLWVGDDRDNASRVFRALAEFGAPLTGVDPADFAKPDLIYQLGVPPLRIDVLTSISGVDFEAAWVRRREAAYGDVTARFIALEDLLRNKRAVARASDLADCERLEAEKKRIPGKPALEPR